MFDKTRLPYVALDVFCVILGTSVPLGRGRVCARAGVWCTGGCGRVSSGRGLTESGGLALGRGVRLMRAPL